jgi:hypothetical protein
MFFIHHPKKVHGKHPHETRWLNAGIGLGEKVFNEKWNP